MDSAKRIDLVRIAEAPDTAPGRQSHARDGQEEAGFLHAAPLGPRGARLPFRVLLNSEVPEMAPRPRRTTMPRGLLDDRLMQALQLQAGALPIRRRGTDDGIDGV
jgi:hypothetical protein